MSERVCSIRECGREVLARGWCALHYGRWHRTGDPTATPKRHGYQLPSTDEELLERVAKICAVRPSTAVRLAAYFEARAEGLDQWAAGGQQDLSDTTVNRYERWFGYFRAQTEVAS